jgi:hypothetical protein
MTLVAADVRRLYFDVPSGPDELEPPYVGCYDKSKDWTLAPVIASLQGFRSFSDGGAGLNGFAFAAAASG